MQFNAILETESEKDDKQIEAPDTNETVKHKKRDIPKGHQEQKENPRRQELWIEPQSRKRRSDIKTEKSIPYQYTIPVIE